MNVVVGLHIHTFITQRVQERMRFALVKKLVLYKGKFVMKISNLAQYIGTSLINFGYRAIKKPLPKERQNKPIS